MLKWVGAAYLVYIGIRMLTASQPYKELIPSLHLAPAARLRMIFLQGLLTNVLNPKVALFFLAFLQQFIPADASAKVTAFVILGLIFNLTGTLWNLGVAWCAGRLQKRSSRDVRSSSGLPESGHGQSSGAVPASPVDAAHVPSISRYIAFPPECAPNQMASLA